MLKELANKGAVGQGSNPANYRTRCRDREILGGSTSPLPSSDPSLIPFLPSRHGSKPAVIEVPGSEFSLGSNWIRAKLGAACGFSTIAYQLIEWVRRSATTGIWRAVLAR